MADDVFSGQAQYAPGSFSCHEALHLASVLRDIADEHLASHPAVMAVPEWREMAEKAVSALFDLHQAIGARHL